MFIVSHRTKEFVDIPEFILQVWQPSTNNDCLQHAFLRRLCCIGSNGLEYSFTHTTFNAKTLKEKTMGIPFLGGCLLTESHKVPTGQDADEMSLKAPVFGLLLLDGFPPSTKPNQMLGNGIYVSSTYTPSLPSSDRHVSSTGSTLTSQLFTT